MNIIRDITINEFKPNGTILKIKEADNTVCSMLEVRDNIFACGFLLGQIDVYDVNYLYCLLTIYEHKSRVSNMVLLKDKSILTSSFDHTMKKIRITNNNSYIVDYVFSSLKNVVYKGIELNNSDIVSISFRGNIDIFKKNDKNNNYSNLLSHEIANEEIYNVIELSNNKEIAFSTDECLRFFSIDSYQNIGNVHLLEFAKGNNMISINKNIMAILLKHHLGLVNISQRQCIFKTSLGEVGKPECFFYLKDNTILVGMSNNQKENKNIEFIFKQYNTKMNKCKLIAEKMEIINKIKKDDYCIIITMIELKNGVIAYGTAGFEEFKLVGNISIID
jgi:WD40 repeat protein